MKPTRWPLVAGLLFLVSLTALALLGCGKSKDTVAGPPPTPTPVDELLAQANTALETILGNLTATPPTRPSDVNFSVPLSKYEQVLAQEPANPTANFGAGLLGVLSLSYDSEVNAAFTEWKNYLQDHVPFETGAAPSSPLGIPTALTPGRAAYRLPFSIVPLTTVALARSTRVAADPQISRVQAILRDRVLPRLTVAITRLGQAAADPAFVFVVTPAMQGDPDASPIELDPTDLLAFKAAAELLAAACHSAVSYNLGFASYDSPGLISGLSPGGSWLKLRSDGATHMLGARTMLLASLDDVDASIASLQAETDDQDDDFIGKGISPADIDDILLHVGQVREGLTSGITLNEDWDQNAATPKTDLTIRVDRLFTNPVADWKAILPPYAVSTEQRPLSGYWQAESGTRQVTAVLDSAGYYYGNYWRTASSGQPMEEYFYGPEDMRAPLSAAAQQEYLRISAKSGFTGDYGISINYEYAYLNAGSQLITVSWYDDYYLGAQNVYVPVITWTANSYDQWTWNVAALNGLFPGITSSPEMLSTFGYDPAWWSKTLVLDWTGNGAPVPPRLAVARRR
jgi:hypothetical protein